MPKPSAREQSFVCGTAPVASIAIASTLLSTASQPSGVGHVIDMRFLGVGDSADLAAIYLRLVEDGHDVKVFIGNTLCQDTLAGLIDRVPDWKAELDWVRAAGTDGCILFENVGAGRGELQDRLRRDGFNVIGSSAYGARLENDRAFAQRTLAELGFSTLDL